MEVGISAVAEKGVTGEMGDSASAEVLAADAGAIDDEDCCGARLSA